jgi:hypothetical protein
MAANQSARSLVSERCIVYQTRVKKALTLLESVERGLLAVVPVVSAGASSSAPR